MLPTERHRAILASDRQPGIPGAMQRGCKRAAEVMQEVFRGLEEKRQNRPLTASGPSEASTAAKSGAAILQRGSGVLQRGSGKGGEA